MTVMTSRWTNLSPYLKSLMRIVAAFMFLQAGTVKLFGWPMAMPGGQTVELFSQTGIGGLMEVIGGALLLVGLFTRPVAFLVAGEMAVAYFLGHFPNGFWPHTNMGDPAVLFCFVFLYIAAKGSGLWSVDSLRGAPAAKV